MSKVVYEGSRAGLNPTGDVKGVGGNANSLFDYTLYCACESEGHPTNLGPVGKFVPNAEGQRSALCPKCLHVTILDKNAKVAARVPFNLLKTH